MTTQTKPGELARFRRLDPQMVGRIHDRYFPEVFGFVKSRLKDAAAAEEITGAVFIRLLKMVNLGLSPRTRLKTWLLGTAAHLVNLHLENTKK